MEALPRSAHHDHDRRGQGGALHPDGHSGGADGGSRDPIREAGPHALDEWTGGKGVHWGLLLDLLLTGQVASAADLGAQRLKALEGHSRVATSTGVGCPREAFVEQHDGDHEGRAAGKRGAEGLAACEPTRPSRQRQRTMEGMAREEREGRQGRKAGEGRERQKLGQAKDSLEEDMADGGNQEQRGGFRGGMQWEDPSGRGTPGEETMMELLVHPSLLVAGRNPGSKGVRFLKCLKGSHGPRPFHEFEQDFSIGLPAQLQSADLHPQATATMVGRDNPPSSAPRTMAEIFKRAVGTLTCDDKMRSNKGEASGSREDFLPLPVPQADSVLAATIMAINHTGGWKNRSPGDQDVSDLQSLAVKKLSDLVHRHGMWKVEEVAMNFADFFKRKSVGEEVKVGMTMNWQAIRDSFPQEVCCLELQRFCRLGTLEYVVNFLEYVVNFEDFLLPQQDWKGSIPNLPV